MTRPRRALPSTPIFGVAARLALCPAIRFKRVAQLQQKRSQKIVRGHISLNGYVLVGLHEAAFKTNIQYAHQLVGLIIEGQRIAINRWTHCVALLFARLLQNLR